jgi:hypothetical protein
MAKVPGFAKAFAGRWRIVEMDIRLCLRTRLIAMNILDRALGIAVLKTLEDF